VAFSPQILVSKMSKLVIRPPEQIKIWLDDVRLPPEPREDWRWCLTAEAVINLINDAGGLDRIAAISFDNDLGTEEDEGYRVLNALEEYVATHEIKKVPVLTVHSANPVAHAKMKLIIDRISRMVEKPS
jgi:hypothetical protein